MIYQPSLWTVIPGVAHYTLVPPEGPAAGAVRYVERARPLRRLGDLVDERLRASAKGFTDPVIGAPERLVTAEGEHAAFVTVRGKVAGAPALRCLGFVFGDDFTSRIDGLTVREESFERFTAIVRDLVLRDSHALGIRRRRFAYAAPADWQPIVRGFITDWIPRRFPSEWAMITVFPAEPSTGAPGILPDLLGKTVERGFEIEKVTPAQALKLGPDLAGGIIEAVGRQAGKRAHRAIAACVDGRYLYTLELVSRSEDATSAHRDDFVRLAQSIEKVPAPGAPKKSGEPSHWVD